MKNIFKTKRLKPSGLTLAELLVASILIGIVMVGIVSFSQTMKQLQITSERSAVPAARVAAAMAQIVRDSEIINGSSSDEAVVEANGQICFRHDTNWVCYQHCGEDDKRLWRCTVNDGTTDDCVDCAAAPGFFSKPFIHLDDTDFYLVQRVGGVATAPIEYIEFTLSNCERPPCPATADPMNNPVYSLTTRVNPYSHSR